MANLNKVFLMGNLTRDLEIKYGKSGQPVTNARIAVNRTYMTQSGEKKEEVCYVTVVIWGKQAESCHTFLKKGSSIFVEGRLQYRILENEGADKKNILEVVAERVQFLDKKKKEGEPAQGARADEGTPEKPASDDQPF